MTLLRDWIDETPWMRHFHTRAPMERFWRGALATQPAWVAVHGRTISGFCLRNVGEENNIGALYVTRTARRKGVGRKLLDLAKADCNHITVWAFEKNTKARRFYAREGLVEVSREQDEFTRLVDVRHVWKRNGDVRVTPPPEAADEH